MKLLRKLWRDEAGFVISSELVLVATILVLGMIVGLTTIRDQVVTELADVADAISEVDQSFSFGRITGHCSSTAGSEFEDVPDFCDVETPEGQQGLAGDGSDGACIDICDAPVGGETG